MSKERQPLSAEERAAWVAAKRRRRGDRYTQPNYLLSYLRLAAAGVEDARETGTQRELAVACAFLQRHVAEMTLRTLLTMFDEITPLPVGYRGRAHGGDSLKILLRDLYVVRQWAIDGGATYSDIPLDLGVLIAEFEAAGDSFPSGFRYPTSRCDDKPGGSLEDESELPIESWQARLDRIVYELFGSGDLSGPPDSLGRALEAAIQARLAALGDDDEYFEGDDDEYFEGDDQDDDEHEEEDQDDDH